MTRGKERGRGLYLATPHHMTNGGVPKRLVASAGSRVMSDCSEMRNTERREDANAEVAHGAVRAEQRGVSPRGGRSRVTITGWGSARPVPQCNVMCKPTQVTTLTR